MLGPSPIDWRDDEDGELVGRVEAGKESKLRLFLTEIVGREGDGMTASTWTPKSLNPPAWQFGRVLVLVQVLELWPVLPHCEHFLPIVVYSLFDIELLLHKIYHKPPLRNFSHTNVGVCV